MLKDVIVSTCNDCGDVSFIFDNDGWLEINPCACVDGMSDLDWINE